MADEVEEQAPAELIGSLISIFGPMVVGRLLSGSSGGTVEDRALSAQTDIAEFLAKMQKDQASLDLPFRSDLFGALRGRQQQKFPRFMPKKPPGTNPLDKLRKAKGLPGQEESGGGTPAYKGGFNARPGLNEALREQRTPRTPMEQLQGLMERMGGGGGGGPAGKPGGPGAVLSQEALAADLRCQEALGVAAVLRWAVVVLQCILVLDRCLEVQAVAAEQAKEQPLAAVLQRILVLDLYLAVALQCILALDLCPVVAVAAVPVCLCLAVVVVRVCLCLKKVLLGYHYLSI